MLREKRRGEPPDETPSGLTSIRHAVAGLFQPVLGGLFELAGDDGGLGEPERSGGAAQPMGVAAQLLDCGRVVASGDQPFSQLCDCPQLIARSVQVVVPDSGGQPEVVALGGRGGAHGLQDITSLSYDLMTDPAVGLCATCRWVRIVTNRRGSVFYRCLRADMDPPDPRFVRYPPLPVLRCPGYERSGTDPLPESERDHDER